MSRLRGTRQRLRESIIHIGMHRAAPAIGRTFIELDYPPSERNVPRYVRAHQRLDQLIGSRRASYAEALAMFGSYGNDLAKIPVQGVDENQPAWDNIYLPGLDAAAIYAFLRSRNPSTYLEVGSGNSTRFAARSKQDGRLSTDIVSVDPLPRASINDLCDEIVRAPLEATDPALWRRLRPGDIVFMDGSHRVFMNNDVVTFFLDLLPDLSPGVLVGIHDIFLPYDYPPEIAHRYYSEQYMLAAWLLGGAEASIVFPAYYVFVQMHELVDQLWDGLPQLARTPRHGGAFWFEM
jgi:hypothetical protein